MSAPLTAAPAADCRFDPEQHRYTINSVEIPSVTQVLSEEKFIDFSMVPDATLEQAQARGTYVHAVLHFYLEGDFDIDDCDPKFRGYVDSALEYLDRLRKKTLRNDRGETIGLEYRFWHPGRMFAGTIDYLGWDEDQVLSIDDFKTGLPSDVATPLQLAAYELGVRDCLLPTLPFKYRNKPIRRRAVKLFRDGKPGRPEVYDDPRDLSIFLNALTCVHYRRNGMRHS